MIASTIIPEHVILYFARKSNCSMPDAERLFEEMVGYLDLCSAATQELQPSPCVDEAWHTFILHTREYADFCSERYGRFIHHRPFPIKATQKAEVETDWGKAECGGDGGSCRGEA